MRRTRSAFGCLVLVTALLTRGVAADPPAPGGATGNQPAPEAASSGSPTVTIEASREQERIEGEVRSFISTVAVSDPNEPLARWEEAVCPLVTGLPRDRGVAVFKRVSEIVTDAGLPLGPRDCSPNLLIIATPEPTARLQELWTTYPKMMNDDRGRGGIERFIHGSQPIRAWHNVCSEAPTTEKGLRTGARCMGRSVGSLITFAAVRSIYSAVVVVDLERTKGIDDRQLGSYAGMVALTPTRDNGAPAVPSILRLFSEPESSKPPDLSNWDRAFLKALYSVNPGDASQLAEIAHEMQRQLTPGNLQ